MVAVLTVPESEISCIYLHSHASGLLPDGKSACICDVPCKNSLQVCHLQVVLTGTPSTLVLLPSALQLHQLLVSQALQAVLNILLPAACALSLGQQTQLCNL